MTSSIQPIGLPYLDVDNLVISRASLNTLSITSGRARDNSNNNDMTVGATTTLNAAVVGLNGIDRGIFAASTMYAIYAVASTQNKAPSGYIMSTSLTQPVLPFNYDAFRLIGFWATTSAGTPTFFGGTTLGNGKSRRFLYQTNGGPGDLLVLDNGNSTTFANVSLANVVPAIASCVVKLTYEFTPGTNDDTFRLTAPSGLGAVTFAGGGTATRAYYNQTECVASLVSGVPTIEYSTISAGDNLDLYVYGFDYYI